MSNITKFSLAGILLIVIVISNSIFVISEVERGVTLRFGQMIEADVKPGIHVKIPFVDDVRRFDARILTCLLYTSPSPRDKTVSRMPSSA